MEEQKHFFLKTKLENQESNKDDTEFFELIKYRFNWKEYVSLCSELESKGFFLDRERIFLSEYGKSILNELELKLLQKEKDNKYERGKLKNEFILSKWTVKTFWIVFIFGLLGGFYSAYDLFIKIPSIEEKFQKIESDILKNKDTIKELRTLILTQKKADSLNHSNSELYK
jgi:hypothetical protein